MSVDKTPETGKYVNINPYADFINFYGWIIKTVVENNQFLWGEFLKLFEGQNPYQRGSFMHSYFEIYIRPFLPKQN